MINQQLNIAKASDFHRKLLSWYDENCRDLPWRCETDPYYIWVSEVMLQQTRVETVIPYYHRFLAAYPSISALAHASQDDVLKLWEGLGYYARARHFLQAVREVHASYAGCVPANPEVFGRLCGVGDYTRAAVGSIAFNHPLAAVDGNVRRVFCRLFAIDEDPTKASVQKEIKRLAQTLLDSERPGDYNQAVMELGAVVCTPRSPRCNACPVKEFCQGQAIGLAAELPMRKKKKVLPVHALVAAVIIKDKKCLLRQRHEKLLHGLWEFPNVSVTAGNRCSVQQFSDLLGCNVTIGEEWMTLQHTFSHLRWEVSVCNVTMESEETVSENWFWAGADDLEQMAFSTVYQPVLKQLLTILK